MYYIYHIPGVKIGCTDNIKRRIKRQGFESYEILEQHEDGWYAGDRERILQAQYGYTVDQTHYMQVRESLAKASIKSGILRKGKSISEEHKNTISIANKGNTHALGYNHKSETKTIISAALKGIVRTKYACPHCNQLIGGIGNLNQHINNKHNN